MSTSTLRQRLQQDKGLVSVAALLARLPPVERVQRLGVELGAGILSQDGLHLLQVVHPVEGLRCSRGTLGQYSPSSASVDTSVVKMNGERPLTDSTVTTKLESFHINTCCICYCWSHDGSHGSVGQSYSHLQEPRADNNGDSYIHCWSYCKSSTASRLFVALDAFSSENLRLIPDLHHRKPHNFFIRTSSLAYSST